MGTPIIDLANAPTPKDNACGIYIDTETKRLCLHYRGVQIELGPYSNESLAALYDEWIAEMMEKAQ